MQTDLCVSSAGKASPYSCITRRVLETETGFVSLSNLQSSGDIQQVVVTKRFHAVVMPEEEREIFLKQMKRFGLSCF